MSNLLKETIEGLASHKKGPKDVLWVGSSEVWFTWDEFAAIANFSYDDGFGSQEICPDLKVVGADFWMERHEYDGSEWWEYKSHPVRPLGKIVPKKVKCRYSETVEEMNRPS